jgi:hypothetical protein
MDGVSDTVEHQTGWLLQPQAGSKRYYRFQTALEPGSGSMDDTSSKHIKALQKAAADLIATEKDELDSLCKVLKVEAPPPPDTANTQN